MPDPWPLTLPQSFKIEGADRDTPENRLFSEPDEGLGKTRPKSSSGARRISGTLPALTLAQVEILDDFVEGTLIQGSLPFTFPADPARPASGPILVRFANGGLPHYSAGSHDLWIASMTLDILK